MCVATDQVYLFYVNRLYQEIGKQLNGLMFKDGGPVIGVQIENEYRHSAAPWGFTYQDARRETTVAGRDKKITQIGVGINDTGNEFANMGKDHMKALKQLAVNAGLVISKALVLDNGDQFLLVSANQENIYLSIYQACSRA